MAQQSNNGHSKNEEGRYSTPDIFITSKGVQVRLIGLNPARLQRLQTAGKAPQKPFREIPNDLGSSQKEELSVTDLQNEEERLQWAEYQAALALIEEKRNDNVMKYVFTDGFEVDASDMEEWKRQETEEYGLELPESPVQLRMDYINAKVIGNADDLADIMAGVMERTGVPAEMLDEVKNSFRRTVQRDTVGETAPE